MVWSSSWGPGELADSGRQRGRQQGPAFLGRVEDAREGAHSMGVSVTILWRQISRSLHGPGWIAGCGARYPQSGKKLGLLGAGGGEGGKEGQGGLGLQSRSLQYVVQGDAESPPRGFCTCSSFGDL